ncbi:IS110 family transposase [Blastochloris tepida]|nr:IS110 family transposase [Blastochloris tepida]
MLVMLPHPTPFATHLVGIDVSKDWLDIAFDDTKVERVDNTPAALQRLARRLVKAGLTTAGLEPTGGYERLAVAVLREAGLTVLQVDSWRCRQFAKACGQRAKSDPLDARIIRAFMLHHPCRPFPEPSQAQSDLTAWVREITRAEADIRRLENRKAHPTLAAITARLDAEIAALRETVAAAEQAIEALIAADPAMDAKAKIITSVPGIANKTARVLLAEAPELGRFTPRQAGAIGGCAPYRNDSGKARRPAHIEAGRRALKRACYLAAFAAIHWNPWAKQLYADLKARGKPAKVALIAIARKLLTILNAMIRDNKPWRDPKTA